MNFQFYLEKLKTSEEYKKFMKEHPNAYLCSAFFIIDIEGKRKGDQSHIDFFEEDKNLWWSFKLEDGVKLIPMERVEKAEGEKNPAKLKANSSLEFKEIESLIQNEMDKQEINKKMQKIIMILQNIEDKDVYLCTVFVSGLGIIKVHFEDVKDKSDCRGKITFFEKKSFFDFIRKA